MFYAFKGSGVINNKETLRAQQACRFDTSGPKTAMLTAGKDGYRGLVFTGQMTREKILWHGPFVCTDRAQLSSCFQKYQRGDFPPKRASWDYKDVRKKPNL